MLVTGFTGCVLVDAVLVSGVIVEVVVACCVLEVEVEVVESVVAFGVATEPPDGVVLGGRSHSGCK